MYERISLEAFQAGPPWATILRKRPAFRTAVEDFDPDRVARYGDADVERLIADAGIVRNRAKIRVPAVGRSATWSRWSTSCTSRRCPVPRTRRNISACGAVRNSTPASELWHRVGMRGCGSRMLLIMGFPLQPQFHMPFRSRLNPHVDQARLHAEEWAGRMGMFDEEYLAWPERWSEKTFTRADFPLFIALTHPDADADELDLVTSWHVALWFVDDLFLPLFRRHHDQASAEAQVERLMLFLPLDALPRPLSPDNPVERAFAGLWTRTAATMSPLWRDRFVSSVRRFLEGVLWELEHVDDAVSDLIEYLGARRDFGGLQFTAVLMEHGLGELPPNVHGRREFRTALDAFVDGVSLHNDIVSYDREVEEGTVGNNGVEVTHNALGVDRRGAGEVVNALLTARVNTLADAPAHVPPEAAAFIEALQEALAGSYRWHELTGRFRQATAGSLGMPRGMGTSAVYAFRRHTSASSRTVGLTGP
ncbi:DNA-3-methyladenine glycosylase I [Streptomyces noursei]|uniref:terpene synthase family protein n=1 Tax=Streptomyces noursei TaxID=1971 RepID=UPI0035DE39EC